MSRDVHDAVDDARNGNMSSYNALPLKKCTPTSGHQIWQPNVKDGEAVCLAHQSRCKVNWNAESFNADRFNGLTTNFGTPKYDVHDAVDDARNGNMSSYNALPLKECTPTSGHQIWQPNVKDGEAVCLAHQSRCKVNWNAESLTKNAVGMIVRDGDPSSPPSDIFMADDPTSAPAGNLGGPTAPGNAGVPADVGGDDLVPYDSPSAPPAEEFGAEGETSDWTEMKEDLDEFDDRLGVYFIPKTPQTHSEMASMIKEYFGIGGSFPSQGHFHFITTDGYDIIPTTENDEGIDEPVFHIRKQDNERAWDAEYKNIESKPYQHLLLGVAFTVCGLYFWSTAGSYVRNWVGVRVEKYAPGLLTPTSQVILTTAALFGIIGFGWKLYGSTKGTTIGSIDGLLGGLVEPID